jgi:threonine dehydrogenase-like Zn-dependent dehydrogenase
VSSVTGRAVFFSGVRSVEVRPVDVTAGADTRLVTSRLMGISHGTEMLCYRGRLPQADPEETLDSLPDSLEYPLRYGYINVGELDDGSAVFAFYPHQDVFAAPEGALVPLPDSMAAEDAVFLASMETALSIVHDAAPRIGDNVAIMGLGVIGLLAAALCLKAGARVIGVEPAAVRRRMAQELGCAVVDPGVQEATETLLRETDRRGPDIGINTSGTSAGLQTAIDAACMEGLVVEASWHGGMTSELELGRAFHRRRVTLKSSQVSNLSGALTPRWDKQRRMRTVIALLEELEPGRLISHRFPLSKAAEAFRLIDEQPEQTLQVVLEPD